ncbi:50S ribosomal protein L28 [Candidatus Fermentibacteria bacterium]|nr:50S ribosomal protein L28 [Candidatus Fermentibacteria bacterium]
MSLVCFVCGKKPSVGCRVSHSMRHTKHRWKPNLQPATVVIDGVVRRVRLCTSCIKAGKIRKA